MAFVICISSPEKANMGRMPPLSRAHARTRNSLSNALRRMDQTPLAEYFDLSGGSRGGKQSPFTSSLSKKKKNLYITNHILKNLINIFPGSVFSVPPKISQKALEKSFTLRQHGQHIMLNVVSTLEKQNKPMLYWPNPGRLYIKMIAMT